MELKMFKLITGDVVMADTEIKDGVYLAKKPVQLIMSPTEGGVGLMPYDAIFTQKEQDEISFKEEHVMYEMPIADVFEKSYIEFKTGIEV